MEPDVDFGLAAVLPNRQSALAQGRAVPTPSQRAPPLRIT